MDRGAWQATVHGVARVGHDLATKERENILHGVAKSQTRLSNFHKKKKKEEDSRSPTGSCFISVLERIRSEIKSFFFSQCV